MTKNKLACKNIAMRLRITLINVYHSHIIITTDSQSQMSFHSASLDNCSPQQSGYYLTSQHPLYWSIGLQSMPEDTVFLNVPSASVMCSSF